VTNKTVIEIDVEKKLMFGNQCTTTLY